MNVRPTLICFFFLSLQDGNSGLAAKAQISVSTGTAGEDITVTCPFPSSGNTRFFCKNECKGGDLLIETTDVTSQSGRYRIEYEEFLPGANVSVSISQLTKSDSGRYRCGLDGSIMFDFRIIVVDALLRGNPPEVKTFHKTSGDNVVAACFFPFPGTRLYFCKEQCEDKNILVQTNLSAQTDRYSIEYVRGLKDEGFVYVNISQLTRYDSGLYRCGMDIPLTANLYHEFRISVTDAPTTTEPITTLPDTETPSPRGVLLYVGLTLVVLVLVSLSVLILCRRRRSTAKEPPVETEYAVIETNRVYEDIREDGQRQSPPVEISSVDSTAKYSKPGGAETSDDYSVIYAANFQYTAEDDSGRLSYSPEDDPLVYSVPRVKDSSDAHRPEDDPSVYSTVH